MKKEITVEQYKAIWEQMLTVLEANRETVFEVAFTPTGAVVRNVRWTTQPNGVNSGDFWNDEVSMKEGK